MRGPDYLRGFEDAVELCLFKVSKAKTLKKAKTSIERIWSLIKEKKLDQLERELEELNL